MAEEPLRHPSVLSNLIDTNLPPSAAQLQIAREILSQNELQIEKLKGEIAQLGEPNDLLAQELLAVADSASKMWSIVSPWRRLPPKLLSHIFVLCAEDDPDYIPAVDHMPLLPLQVCHAWRSLALATPALWVRLAHSILEPKDITIIDAWLSRSGACPLELDIFVGSQNIEPADPEQLFKKHSHHLQTVRIAAPQTLIPLLLDGAPLLHDLTLWKWPYSSRILDAASGPRLTMRSLPSLRQLSGPHSTLYNLDIPWHQLTHLNIGHSDDKGSAHSNLQILSRCPGLRSCNLGLEYPYSVSLVAAQPPLLLPYLETLAVDGRTGDLDQFFSSLVLPQLRNLTCGAGTPNPTIAGEFLKRSACPLETLHLCATMSSTDVMQWLLPTITSLTLNIHLSSSADDLLRALTVKEEGRPDGRHGRIQMA
ncbi:hypothetical protein C8J57DRAFT_1220843 [Mycena rebaudengoi]|nr:hypothetical protein C8J57DRAFT_1220843 [Mycena rebaudengoi]